MIQTRGRGVVYGELWYDEEPGRPDGVDILVHRQRAKALGNARDTPTLQLATDLTRDADAICADFDTTCRYHIRRAGKSDGLTAQFATEPADRAIEAFRSFYDGFAHRKSIWLADGAWLGAAARAHQLALSVATCAGEPLVWHAYVTRGGTAGLQYTCSDFRDRDPASRSRIARANRWLHWQDMLRLKALGFACYDWGGVFADECTPERAGINNFKRSFGPRLRHTYDCAVPLTPRGRIWLPLREAWRNLGLRNRQARRPQALAAGVARASAA